MNVHGIQTPVEAPGTLALLLPTRGRPQECARLLDSIEQTVTRHDRISVRCLVDDDDKESQQFLERTKGKRKIGLEVYVSGPTKTQGERYNILREKLHPYPEFYMPMADDVVCVTPGWDEMIFEAFRSVPDNILMCFPGDVTVGPDQATYTIIHAAWTNQIGRFATGWFPYWYEDCWVDEVSMLIGRKQKLPFTFDAPEGKGKTQGMRNLPFWEKFYILSREERCEEARKLAARIHLHNPRGYEEELLQIEERRKKIVAVAPNRSIEELSAIERELTGVVPGTPPSARYVDCEKRAVWELSRTIATSLRKGDSTRVPLLLETLALASDEVWG